ncbi:aquaporin NIP-type [Spatholobus suberectus]|nr:aquaporin NIP-type [Spatholobus suberectus]
MATKAEGIQEEEMSKSYDILHNCSSNYVVTLAQKVIAEVIGTYFVVFAGCGSVAVNKIYGSVTFPGVCVTGGLIVMVTITLLVISQELTSILQSPSL